LIFIGAFYWALHDVVLGKVQGKIAAHPFALGQILVCGMLDLATGLFLEHPSQTDLLAGIPAMFFIGAFSIAIGFTLQVVAQKHTPTCDSALIMSLESVFTVLFGWIFLHEDLLPVQIAGCILILSAVVLVQSKNGKMKIT
jgi:drug/metabolite transporter (DMT)-like permease